MMLRPWHLFPLALVLAVSSASSSVPVSASAFRPMAEIQTMVDQAAEGQILTPPPGLYQGHLRIEKPLILDGQGKVTLDGGGQGTVVLIKTNNATIRNLTLQNTGVDHNGEDAAVQVRGNNNVVKDTLIRDALFGIDLQQSHFNVLRRNRISSKNFELGMRGDAIRLWYSDDNVLEDNVIRESRDFVLWYSKRNRVTGTDSSGGRYGMHFMFSVDNVIESNRFVGNSIGISMMYDQGDVVRNNVISHSSGASGICVSLKEASAVVIEDNEIVYCAYGMLFDISPFQPDHVNKIERNHMAYNDIAVGFSSEWERNNFVANHFDGNITDVAVYGSGSAKRNEWRDNRWDTYQGFDRNHDGIGDSPHRQMSYAGQLWMDVPNTRFFKGTPILEVLDFLDRLAPFSTPVLMLEDKSPRLAVPAGESP